MIWGVVGRVYWLSLGMTAIM